MARKQAAQKSESNLAANKVMALKKKAKPVPGALWVQIGKQKLQLPNVVHVLHNAEEAFLSIKPSSQIVKLGKGVKKLAQAAETEVADAYKRLLAAGRQSRAPKASAPKADPETVELIAKLEARLKSQGLKAAIDPKTGKLRPAKPRPKRK